MCDILVATPKVTKNKKMIFAKNSDRDPNEAQIVEYIPRKKQEDDKVKMTYAEFPQISETYAIMISRPWWIWGAEMGVNEFGLAIGNTAVFTNQKNRESGILGMDIIRLALERNKYAKDALDFIIDIIENYGQGGSGSYEHKFLYHNSFIIADPKNAYVLETADRYWVTKKINKYYSISNALTIGKYWDDAADSVRSLSKKYSDFDFARYFSDKFYTYFAQGRIRRSFTYNALTQNEGDIDINIIMQILRSHEKESFNPLKGSMKSICMHYGGRTKPSQTASSQISILEEQGIHWFTGESDPCMSIFKPLYFKTPYWENGERPLNRYTPNNFWWRAEIFHRKFILNYSKFIKDFKRDRDYVQEIIFRSVSKEKKSITKSAFKLELELIKKWEKNLYTNNTPLRYKLIWEKINRQANIPNMEGI